jgi:hypothetical protein
MCSNIHDKSIPEELMDQTLGKVARDNVTGVQPMLDLLKELKKRFVFGRPKKSAE